MEGKSKTCHGIALDTRQGRPLLLVCSRNNNCVEYWDLDSNFVTEWSQFGLVHKSTRAK